MISKKITILLIIIAILTSNAAALIQQEKHSLPINVDTVPLCRTMEPTKLEYYSSLNQPKPNIVEPPIQFTWTDNNGDWTTPARNQGDCGSCWAFAAIGILESVINIRENNPCLDPDLSEQYILSCLSTAGSCRGGNSNYALRNIIETTERGNYCNGVPLESCMPYQADDDIPCSEKSIDWEEKLVPIVDYGIFDASGAEDRQIIKSQIMEKGPLFTGMYASDEFRSWGILNHGSEQYFPHSGQVSWINHVVIIVGWHDDLSIGNGGYWICKNSWGPFWGHKGFFNIEYETLNIDKGPLTWVDYGPESFDWQPVAVTGGPYYGNVMDPIYLSATDSFDVDGEIIDYLWDFGYGEFATGATVSNIFENKGIFNVSLTVTDETGKQDTKETAVFVNPWSVGNTWEYLFSEMRLDFFQEQTKVVVEGAIPSIVFEIVKETSETYTMKFSGTINADITMQFSTIDLMAQLSKTKISGEIIFLKQNHSIKRVDCDIDGKIIFPEIIQFPFSFESAMEIDIEPDLKYIDYPLRDNKKYDVPSLEVKIDGDISSRLLKIIYFINKIASLFGKDFIPEDLVKFLPDIKIDEVLNDLLGNNNLIIPFIPNLSMDEVSTSVAAGTFNSFHITKGEDIGIYYSHDVENIIKIDIELSSISTTIGNVDLAVYGELIDTNF